MNKEYIDIKLNIFESMYNDEINDIQCDYLIESFNECNNYEDYKLAIYEAENYNIITEYYRDKLLDTINSVFCEKASKMEYKIRAFKKRYKYDEKEKTIIVNGEKYKCDLDVKSKFIKVKTLTGDLVSTVRMTAADLNEDNPVIYLDENFFKLKNPRRQDAVLQHEIGHTKLHSVNSKSNKLDKSKITGSVFNGVIASVIKESLLSMGYKPGTKEYKEILKETVESLSKEKEEYLKFANSTKNEKKIRNKIIQIAKKYEDPNNPHGNFVEIEADRYAANHSSTKDLKKGLQEITKRSTKDKEVRKSLRNSNELTLGKMASSYGANDISDKDIHEDGKSLRKMANDEYRSRSKALKDKDLQDSKIYK